MTHVYYPSTITATVFSLEDARHRCSKLAWILKDLSTCTSHGNVDVNLERASCILTSCGFFDSLLPQEWEGKKVLTMLLPNEYDSILEEVALQVPEIFNLTSTDLQHNGTYHCWEVGSVAERKSIMLSDGALRTIIDGRGGEEIVPVIMIAGATVGVGGFLVDEVFLGNAQAAGSSSGQNWRPIRVYGDEELAVAASEAKHLGNFPWRKSLFLLRDGEQCFEPPVFDYRDDV